MKIDSILMNYEEFDQNYLETGTGLITEIEKM
jgi:hypothetical protein